MWSTWQGVRPYHDYSGYDPVCRKLFSTLPVLGGLRTNTGTPARNGSMVMCRVVLGCAVVGLLGNGGDGGTNYHGVTATQGGFWVRFGGTYSGTPYL